jgi:hypothetical protein
MISLFNILDIFTIKISHRDAVKAGARLGVHSANQSTDAAASVTRVVRNIEANCHQAADGNFHEPRNTTEL